MLKKPETEKKPFVIDFRFAGNVDKPGWWPKKKYRRGWSINWYNRFCLEYGVKTIVGTLDDWELQEDLEDDLASTCLDDYFTSKYKKMLEIAADINMTVEEKRRKLHECEVEEYNYELEVDEEEELLEIDETIFPWNTDERIPFLKPRFVPGETPKMPNPEDEIYYYADTVPGYAFEGKVVDWYTRLDYFMPYSEYRALYEDMVYDYLRGGGGGWLGFMFLTIDPWDHRYYFDFNYNPKECKLILHKVMCYRDYLERLRDIYGYSSGLLFLSYGVLPSLSIRLLHGHNAFWGSPRPYDAHEGFGGLFGLTGSYLLFYFL